MARCVGMPEKQAVALVTIEPIGQRTSYHERVLDTVLPLEESRGADNRKLRAYTSKMSSYRKRWRHDLFSRIRTPVVG